ncbi:MAG: alpha/beta hydrolase [Candidatus Thorarchaeota archaeon]
MTYVRIEPTEFECEGQKILGNFVIPNGDGPFPGICKFHGLPGGPDQVSGIATDLAKSGFIVLTFDFRGFRKSDGIFSLSGQIKDAYEAVTHLKSHELTSPGWLGVYGASYGGAIAVCAAARDERINAVCLRAPVYDTIHFAKLSLFRDVPDYVLKDMADSFHGINDAKTRERIFEDLAIDSELINPWHDIPLLSPRPLYITTGDADESIDLEGVKDLFDRAKDPKTINVVKGADHRLSTQSMKLNTAMLVTSWFKQICPILHRM